MFRRKKDYELTEEQLTRRNTLRKRLIVVLGIIDVALVAYVVYSFITLLT